MRGRLRIMGSSELGSRAVWRRSNMESNWTSNYDGISKSKILSIMICVHLHFRANFKSVHWASSCSSSGVRNFQSFYLDQRWFRVHLKLRFFCSCASYRFQPFGLWRWSFSKCFLSQYTSGMGWWLLVQNLLLQLIWLHFCLLISRELVLFLILQEAVLFPWMKGSIWLVWFSDFSEWCFWFGWIFHHRKQFFRCGWSHQFLEYFCQGCWVFGVQNHYHDHNQFLKFSSWIFSKVLAGRVSLFWVEINWNWVQMKSWKQCHAATSEDWSSIETFFEQFWISTMVENLRR